MSDTQKRCPRCGKEKFYVEFHRNRARYDGREQYCIECVSETKREQYAAKHE